MSKPEMGTTVLIKDDNGLYFTGLVVSETEDTITVRGLKLGGGWQTEETTFPKSRLYTAK